LPLLRQTGHGLFLVEDLQEPLPELDAAGGEDQLLSPDDRRGGATSGQPLTLELAGQYQDYLAESSHEQHIPTAGIQASTETLLRANPSRSTRQELIQQTSARATGPLPRADRHVTAQLRWLPADPHVGHLWPDRFTGTLLADHVRQSSDTPVTLPASAAQGLYPPRVGRGGIA
jgi:hypothetical protein